MKLAVLSDIHSNYIALEACLSFMEKHPADGVILLGDFVSDCPQPQKTMEKIRVLKKNTPVYAVRGNREEYFLRYRDGLEGDWHCTSYKGSLLYTYERLTGEDLSWFQALTSSMVLSLPGTKALRLAHGSPYSIRELLDEGKENTKECLKNLDTEYILAGHTHRRTLYDYKGKHLINPGSVGVAIGERAMAHMAYITFEHGEWRPKLYSIPYSYEEMKRWFLGSSLIKMAHIWPHCILKSVESGVNVGPLCAKRAHDLAVTEGVINREESAPESYWERAAKELGVV